MDRGYVKPLPKKFSRRSEWRYGGNHLLVILYIFFFILQCKCQIHVKDVNDNKEITTKRNLEHLDSSIESNNCHSCQRRNKTEKNHETDNETDFSNIIDDVLDLMWFDKDFLTNNKTKNQILHEIEDFTNKLVNTVKNFTVDNFEEKIDEEGRALFAKYTNGYRMFQKVKDFVETEIASINLPKTSNVFGFRSFGLKKFFLPLLIGAQIFKSILLAMFLPSILGSFGKILGKGISTLSATSSQASYPPAGDDQLSYNTDANKDIMGYETNQAGVYLDPQEYDANDLSNVDMSRFGVGGSKVSYLPSKNGYYKNQMASASNNYKVFQKIPASSMILSNYDPFYSPLLSRLDGIFARLGLTPSENSIDTGPQVGGQSLSDVKLEACREQLICLMYATPAKYAPYSNLVSAQLSRELNELRRPVSDNPEILRFFRYMRAARRGQEGVDCMRANPACTTNTAPQHTMIAAYHDINKLVTARKINK